MSRPPRVTIGVPVYNGAALLEPSMRALQDQTFTDIEILVSDNASTDATPDVLARLAAADTRIRLVRQPVNLGANGNYSFVARDARGEFLKWASASDLVAPTLVEKCVAALDGAPDAVLAAPRTRLFEGDPAQGTDYDGDYAISGGTPSARLHEYLTRAQLNNAFNGVIRLSALRRTRLVAPFLHADEVLMGHLALLGRWVLVDEPLYLRRMERATSTALQDADARLRHHYPVVDRRTLWQVWKQQAAWLHAGLAAPMGFGERMKVVGHLARRAIWERRALGADVVRAARFATGSR